MSVEAGDRVLVIPLGVHGTVVRLRGEDTVVVMADCATQPVAWKRSEVSKVAERLYDVDSGSYDLSRFGEVGELRYPGCE